ALSEHKTLSISWSHYPVRLGMEVLRHSGYTITREDSLVAATLLTQNLFTHGYALGKL
ncbi:hypothetical protein PQ616_23320, partial [Escherichia coli]